jgi:hypothetical protein
LYDCTCIPCLSVKVFVRFRRRSESCFLSPTLSIFFCGSMVTTQEFRVTCHAHVAPECVFALRSRHAAPAPARLPSGVTTASVGPLRPWGFGACEPWGVIRAMEQKEEGLLRVRYHRGLVCLVALFVAGSSSVAGRYYY